MTVDRVAELVHAKKVATAYYGPGQGMVGVIHPNLGGGTGITDEHPFKGYKYRVFEDGRIERRDDGTWVPYNPDQ